MQALPVRLRPNPPRMITVAAALGLGIVGLIYAWPIDPLVTLLDPVATAVASIGLTLDRQLGELCLFACPSLLVIGSLLPGI